MKQTQLHSRRRRAMSPLATAAVCLLAACGGGGTTSKVTGGPALPIITGNVVSSSGAPVADATVSLGTTSGMPATTQTDASGNFTLPVNAVDVNTGTVVVVTVAKEGHQACTGTVNTSTGSVTGCTVLPLVASDELHPAPGDAILVRLGDGETTGGTINSKLQVAPPFGLSKTVALPWRVGVNPASFQTFTLRVDIRGMQPLGCADSITVLQGADAQAAAPLRTFSAANNNLAESDPQGAFSPYMLQIPASMFSAMDGNVYVKVESGLCVDGTPADPSDDFEFVGLYGKFS